MLAYVASMFGVWHQPTSVRFGMSASDIMS